RDLAAVHDLTEEILTGFVRAEPVLRARPRRRPDREEIDLVLRERRPHTRRETGDDEQHQEHDRGNSHLVRKEAPPEQLPVRPRDRLDANGQRRLVDRLDVENLLQLVFGLHVSRILGSSTPYMRSANRLNTITKIATIMNHPMSTGASPLLIE